MEMAVSTIAAILTTAAFIPPTRLFRAARPPGFHC